MANLTLDPIIKACGKENSKLYHRIYAAIKRYDRIVVFRHIKPDFDAMGSQMGVYTFLKDNFPEKEIHFVGDNHVTMMPRLFPVTESLKNEWFDKPFLAIVMDVGDKDRIADPRFSKAKYIIKIDHHPATIDIANASYLDTSSAAACELAADLFLNWKGTTMSTTTARYLYIGLVGDSGRFMYSSTTAHTFAIAETLVNVGIDIAKIYLDMYQKKLDDLKVTAYILNNFSVSPHGIAYYCLDDKIQEELKITPERGKENVNLFSNIDGINAWCSITQDPNPKEPCWRISIRSKLKDISQVAQKWGGGGHAQASGAKIDKIEQLLDFINDLDALFA
jgi:bifunctional oligoribonuclease and PAP phosphatase NrnA